MQVQCNVSNDGKEQDSNWVDEGREVCIIDPALQGTQCETKESIKDIFNGLLNNTSLRKLVWMNIRERLIWKDVKQAQQHQLWSADDYVKIIFIGKLTVGNGE